MNIYMYPDWEVGHILPIFEFSLDFPLGQFKMNFANMYFEVLKACNIVYKM